MISSLSSVRMRIFSPGRLTDLFLSSPICVILEERKRSDLKLKSEDLLKIIRFAVEEPDIVNTERIGDRIVYRLHNAADVVVEF